MTFVSFAVKMLSSDIKSLIIDMDGVIWKADAPIGDLMATFNRIREHGLKFVFATNNSTKTSEQYVARLKEFGVDAQPWQVITSSQAVAHAMSQKFSRGTKVFMIGEDGVRVPLEEQGFEILSLENAPQAQVVVMGLPSPLRVVRYPVQALGRQSLPQQRMFNPLWQANRFHSCWSFQLKNLVPKRKRLLWSVTASRLTSQRVRQ